MGSDQKQMSTQAALPNSTAGTSPTKQQTEQKPDVDDDTLFASLPLLPEEKEEDPLIVAQREQEEREKALADALNIRPNDDDAMKVCLCFIHSELVFSAPPKYKYVACRHTPQAQYHSIYSLQAFYSDMREVDRENQVNRILGAFKLNPFEALGLPFNSAPEDIRRQYRKVSLTVHPDKCTHPRAKDAFEIIGHAQKELLNEDKRKYLDFVLNIAKEDVKKEWRKAAKHDAAARLAAVLDDSGKEGVEAAWESTEEFHNAWKIKARDFLARAEWRRRKMAKRIKEEEERAKEEYVKEKEDAKRKREADKAWETTRDERVGSWRNFVAGKKVKKTKKSGDGAGGIKPPKAKTVDNDKAYVQRPVGEQYRPPSNAPRQF